MFEALGSRLTYANVAATMAVFLALCGGAFALTGIPDRGGVYHGCVDPNTGALRVVKTASACRKPKTVRRGRHRVHVPGESAIAWNQTGPRGLPGTTGGGGSGDLGAWTPADLSGLPPSSCGPSSRYQAFGNGYDAPSYRRDAYAVVHLRGAVGCAPNTGSPPSFERLFTLPPGYRPMTKEMFAVASANDPTSYKNFGDGAVEVDPDGTVKVIGGQQRFYSLAGVEFDTLH